MSADKLTAAQAAAQRDRARLRASLSATRERIAPKRLAADTLAVAKQEIAQIGSETLAHAKRHRIAIGFSGAAAVAWLLRRPLLRLAPPAARTGYAWLAGNLSFSQMMAILGPPDTKQDPATCTTEDEEHEHG